MITLRDNQEAAARKAVEFFAQDNDPMLMVLPTAWGKSILAAYVAAHTKGNILVVQPSKELLEQNFAKYQMLCGGEDAAIYSASCGHKDVARVTFATIGSIKALGAEFREMGFTKMLIDEAHLYPREDMGRSMLGGFLKDSGITHVLGITATPLKLQSINVNGGKASKLVMLNNPSKEGDFYTDILHVAQVGEMVAKGYWTPLAYQAAGFKADALRWNGAFSEFTEESVKESYRLNDTGKAIGRELRAHADRRRVLVYVPSVDEAKELAEVTPNSAAVWGEMPKKERAEVIAKFKAGGLRTLFNVAVLATGFDCPEVDCLILARSTASLALYYQIVGRATRICPAKKDALIIDLGGNVKRFGRVEDIEFLKEGTPWQPMWRCYGSGGKLLTGIAIHEVGKITKELTARLDRNAKFSRMEMPFGRFRGTVIRELPDSYKRRYLDNGPMPDGRDGWVREGMAYSIGQR